MNGKKSGGRIRRRANSSSNSDGESDRDSQAASKSGKRVTSQRSNSSQPQNSTPKSLRAELNEDDKKRLVADAVFYVLVQEQKRSVHKKGDILKVCYWLNSLITYILH